MFFKVAEVSERNACSLKIDFMNRRGADCLHMRACSSPSLQRLQAISAGFGC